jgi:hypothetical protein
MSDTIAITKTDVDRWRWMAGVGAGLEPAAVLRLLDALEAAWARADDERGCAECPHWPGPWGGADAPARPALGAADVDVLLSAVRGRCWACASAVLMDDSHYSSCRADREGGPNESVDCPGWAFSARTAADALRREADRRRRLAGPGPEQGGAL